MKKIDTVILCVLTLMIGIGTGYILFRSSTPSAVEAEVITTPKKTEYILETGQKLRIGNSMAYTYYIVFTGRDRSYGHYDHTFACMGVYSLGYHGSAYSYTVILNHVDWIFQFEDYTIKLVKDNCNGSITIQIWKHQ